MARRLRVSATSKSASRSQIMTTTPIIRENRKSHRVGRQRRSRANRAVAACGPRRSESRTHRPSESSSCSEADETEVDIELGRRRAHALRQQHDPSKRRRADARHFRPRRRGWPHGPRHHEQNRRRIASPRRRRCGEPCAQPAQESRPAAHARASRNIRRSRVISPRPLKPRRKIAPAPSPASAKWRTKTKQTAAGIFATGFIAIDAGQFEGASSRATSKRARNFPSRFWKTIPPAGPNRIRRTSARSIPKRLPKAPAAKPPRRASRANLRPGHYTMILEPAGRARSGWFSLLRFCRHGRPR